MGRKVRVGSSAVLVAAAVLGGVARPAEAQPGAAYAQEVKEAERLAAESLQLDNEGKYDAALPLAERALAIREKVLGNDHLDVATSLHRLAVIYREKGS